jgi:hypothetical protein
MSTIKVNRLENTSTANGGIDIDTDGHVQFDGLQLPTAGALSNRNLIINGAMQVAQRSTSPQAVSGYGTVDRWQLGHSGTSGAVTQTQGSTGGPVEFPTYYRITNSSTTGAANGYRQIVQFIEAQNIRNSGWDYTNSSSYLTLSLKVRASVSQLYYGRIYTQDGTEKTFSFKVAKADGTAIDADTWTDITVSIPGDSTLTIDNNNGIGIGVVIVPHYGTDLTSSAVNLEEWFTYSSAQLSPDYATTWATTLNATFDITGVQLEVGSKATPFEHRSFHDEQLRCMRYFQHFGNALASDDGVDDGFMMFHNWATSAAYGAQKFIVPMRARPTMASSGCTYYYGGSTDGSITLALVGANTTNGELRVTSVSGLTQGTSGWLRIEAAGAYIQFSAEL